MAKRVLREIVEKAVADYGFRLAVMWGVDDVVAASDLTADEAQALRDVVAPELRLLADPVEPGDRPRIQKRIADLAVSHAGKMRGSSP